MGTRPIYLREWREGAGLTLRDMADRIGLSFSSISKIENGHTAWYRDILEMYGEVLGCEPGVLLLGPPDEATIQILRTMVLLDPTRRKRMLANVQLQARLGGQEGARVSLRIVHPKKKRTNPGLSLIASLFALALAGSFCAQAIFAGGHCHGLMG